jgi:two-component system response regulator DegU
VGAIRVVVADDHPAVLAGVSDMLNRAPDIDVVGRARDGLEALEQVRNVDPDVVLVDIEMPRMSGIEVTCRLAGADTEVRVLAISSYNDRYYIRGVLRNGAAGYIAKDEAPQRLVEAVRTVSDGVSGWVSRRVAERMATWVRADTARQLGFTPTELKVFRLLVKGAGDDDIAGTLGLSPAAVDDCIESVFAKLGTTSRWEAITTAIDRGLL